MKGAEHQTKRNSMAKISIDCGKRYRYPDGSLSGLPDVTYNKKLRDALFSGASLAIEELGEYADLLELIKLSRGRYREGFRVEIKVVIIDPLGEEENPADQKSTAELTYRIENTSEQAIHRQIISQFWECIESRQKKIKHLCETFPVRTESPASVET